MAIVLVDSLAPNKGKFLKNIILIVRIIVIFFLSIGIISNINILTLKDPPVNFRDYSLRMSVELSKTCDSFSSSPLCIVITELFVIILILVSSRFHRRHHDDDHDLNISAPPPTVTPSNLNISAPPPTIKPSSTISTSENDKKNFEDEYDKEEGTDTMDATWKAISGGGNKENVNPKKEQVVIMKKSETWNGVRRRPRRDADVQRVDSEELFTPKSSYREWKNLRKAETFNDAVTIIRRGGLRRDSLSSIEEFNNKIEAFIKKMNDNMRLERQESAQRSFFG